MEPIAIVGAACRFPGAASLSEFWDLLIGGRHGIGAVPPGRWNADAFYEADPKAPGKTNTRQGGFVAGIDSFDADFFGISPREAVNMDPQQRILAEVTYEALEDAGIAPTSLAGSDTAVYVGLMSNDYLQYQLADELQRVDVHTGAGAGYSMTANRLSYLFDLHGPSVAVDSACSSSLTAAFLACQAIWTGQSRVALAAGVNLMLSPAFNVFYAKAGLSAPDGLCKTFSANADGIGRGEGVGVVVLKSLSDAHADRDRVYAVICGGAINHDGRSNGLTAPNRWAQEKLLRAALRHADVRPADLQYVELHGTGTLIGDPIEANALGAVLLEDETQRSAPCLVGSVKTNVGHLEGAAGVAGLIKLALSIAHRRIPPSLWYDRPNPHIPLDRLPLKVNTEATAWPIARDGQCVAGISSFGLGGSNAHLVLESIPPPGPAERRAGEPLWLLISAKSEAALQAQIETYVRFLEGQRDDELPALCQSALLRRDVHEYRLSVLAKTKAELIDALRERGQGTSDSKVWKGHFRTVPRKRIVLAFPHCNRIDTAAIANWLQWAPAARRAWQACRDVFQEMHAPVSLPSADEVHQSRPIHENDPAYSYWHFAAQYAQLAQLTEILPALDAVVADGLGQLAAYCGSGALTFRAVCEALTRTRYGEDAHASGEFRLPCETAQGSNVPFAELGWNPDAAQLIARTSAVRQQHSDAQVILLALTIENNVDPGSEAGWINTAAGPYGYWTTVARLSAAHAITWRRLFEHRHKFVPLPAYPWQRNRYFLEPPETLSMPPAATAIKLAAIDRRDGGASNGTLTRVALLAEMPAERRERLVRYLSQHVAAALHMPADGLDIERPLNTLGIDSLTAVEVKNRIERDLQLTVPVVKFLDGYSVAEFTRYILEAMGEAHAVAEKSSVEQPPVLSVTQERIWQLDQVQPGNPVYNFQSALELRGVLSEEHLLAAMRQVAQRQEVLRTRFGSEKGQPKLEILASVEASLLRDDWSEDSPDEQRRRLQASARTDARTNFELHKPPLWRLRLIRLGSERHILLLTMHHIISDVLSLEIFMQELGAFYSGIRAGASPALEPLTATYQQFARAQRQHVETVLQSEAVTYWKSQLAEPPVHEWLSDFPRPVRPTYQAATVFFDIGDDLVGRVEAFARSERATPFVVLLTAFFVLAHGASRRNDIVIGSPTAGRMRSEYEPLVGMFSYPMAVRAQAIGDRTFQELLQAVRRNVLNAAEHIDLPFARVVELAQPAGTGRGPLLRIMFSYVSRVKAIEFAGLTAARVPTDRGMSDFDWFLTIYQDSGRWVGLFEYNTDLFSGTSMESWSRTYTDIVATAVAAPSTAVASLAKKVVAQEPFRIALGATFTADTLEEVTRHWSLALRHPLAMELAPYNQIFQQLLDPGSLFHSGPQRANVLLVRPEDWVRYTEDKVQRATVMQKSVQDFVKAVRDQAGRFRCPLYIYVCPASADGPELHSVEAAEEEILSSLAGIPGVEVKRAQELLRHYPVAEVLDKQTDKIGHVPFTQDWFTAFGTGLIRRLSREMRAPFKVVALDCDNTLWQGVCGEEGAQGVKISAPYVALQKLADQLAESGMLLCLVSKNDERDVQAVFEQRTDMVLRWDRIIAHRINWQTKSSNLRSLAAELQLGLDSFIFIDDNPVECAEVRSACPEVLTLQLPEDPQEIPAFLQHVWAFDRGEASAEDRKRVQSYRENRDRQSFRQQHDSFSEFLRDLDLVVDIAPVEMSQRARVAQLSLRTNQFNASGLRLDEAGLARAMSDGLSAVSVRVKDRFGDYGLVGAAFYRQEPTRYLVEGVLLSCRVLGRGVEHHMIRALAERAQATGAERLDIVYRELPRNQPILGFLRTLPGEFHASEPAGQLFQIPVTEGLRVRFDPAAPDAEDVPTAEATDGARTVAGAHVERQAALATIARELRDVGAIRARLGVQGRRERRAPSSVPLQNETEHSIAEIWRQILNIDGIGRDDNFFDIGGNSLMLVQVNSRLMERLQREIPITDLFQFPTVASLASHLGNGATRREINLKQSQARGNQAREGMQKRLQQWGARRSVTWKVQ